MLLNLLNSHYLSTHKEFHNKHLGSSCLIIGGGHSIKYMDIKKFKDELIIGVNLSPFHVDCKNLICFITLSFNLGFLCLGS